MTATSCSQVHYPNQITTSSSGQTPCGDQQSTPTPDRIIYGDQMIVPDRYQALYEHQTAAYRGDKNFCVDLQVTSPVGGELLYDWQMQTVGFDTIHCESKRTKSSEKDNLFQSPKTTTSCEDTFYLGQMKTTSVDENVYPGQKRSPNVERSHSPQRTSFGNQSPYVGGFTYLSSCFVAQSQPLGSFSVSPLVLGQLPQEKSDLETHSHVTQKKPPSLESFLCPYQNCKKPYTNLSTSKT
ncbi:hypothetical protein A6R68_00370, partial [Neotoma lepida]